MPTTYVPRGRVAQFQREYGEADHRSEHGEYIALQYDEIPEGVITPYGGGWYYWKGRTQGEQEAFAEAGRNY